MPVDQPERVGVRELRQNLSVYLRRVKEGVTLEVTEHGHPVARLAPVPDEEMDLLDRLIAEGKATPAEGPIEDFLSTRVTISAREAKALQREVRRQGEEKI